MNQNLSLVSNGSTYTDYETVLAAINWCTPSFMGFTVCANASASGGIITLALQLNTPFGSYSKTFQINSNTCFSWSLPIKLGPSIDVCVSNLSTSPNVRFQLRLNVCLTLPIIGKKCAGFDHYFSLPYMEQQNLMGSAPSQEDLTTLLHLLAHNAGNEAQQSCNCQ